jgi:serine/threonine-protein kinase
MTVLANYRAERLISRVVAADSTDARELARTIDKLRSLGNTAFDLLLDGLASDDSAHRDGCRRTLELLVRNKDLPHLLPHLGHSDARVAAGVKAALQNAVRYSPNSLIAALGQPDVPVAPLLDLISHHGSRLDPRRLLAQAHKVPPAHRGTLFRILAHAATDPAILPELINHARSAEAIDRQHAAEVLAASNDSQARQVLVELLSDPEAAVRQAALRALRSGGELSDVAPVVRLLADPDLGIQEQAIELLAHLRNPRTTSALAAMLAHESEQARRAAVEVLSAMGTSDSIDLLVPLLGDGDWWVRTRAGDALLRIGGERVYRGIVRLLCSPEKRNRIAAAELVSADDDQSVRDQLLSALDKTDWPSKKLAMAALATTRNRNLSPLFCRLLDRDATTRSAAAKALVTIGDSEVVPHLLERLNDSDSAFKTVLISALSRLARPDQREQIATGVSTAMQSAEPELREHAASCLRALERRTAATTGKERQREAMRYLKGDTAPEQDAVGVDGFVPGQVIANRYQMIRRIGRGAHGTAVLFHDRIVNDRVVLKFIRPELVADQAAVQRFVREIRLARRVTHQNVIRLHDLVPTKGALAISMEYFPSRTLAKELADRRPVSWPRLKHILLQILSGLDAAHGAGVIHRDIKPANILLGDNDYTKLVDFGISAAAHGSETNLTGHGLIIGTPAYLSPEQIRAEPLDQRSDVYSIGVVFYQMLTGIRPYNAESVHALMYQHLEGGAVPVHELNFDIPEELSQIVASAMAVDRGERVQSAAELARLVSEIEWGPEGADGQD